MGTSNLVHWFDAVVSSVPATDTRVFDHRGQKVDGEYTGLRYNEVQDILSKLSGLSEWVADCNTNQYNCGTLLITTSGRCGNSIISPILCGPFEKCLLIVRIRFSVTLVFVSRVGRLDLVVSLSYRYCFFNIEILIQKFKEWL